MEGKLEAATNALAEALSTLLQICPDVYLQKEGLPRVHADVQLEAGPTCKICKQPLRTLRVLCAICRRRPMQLTKGVNYLQLCWEGSHPDLFKKDIWDRSSSANRLLARTQDVLNQCLALEAGAVRVGGPNYFMDDLHTASFWLDSTICSGAFALTEEVFPMALEWLFEVDSRFFGRRSEWLQARLQQVAGVVASHASWLKQLKIEDITLLTEEALDEGVRLWKIACRKERDFVYRSLCALKTGNTPPTACLEHFKCTLHELEPRLRVLLNQLDALEKSNYDFVLQPTAEIAVDANVPALPWVEHRRRLRFNLPSIPSYFPIDHYRLIRTLALVARMIDLNDMPVGVVHVKLLRVSLRTVIASAIHTSNLCKFTTAPTDMACAFLRGQALMERCGPLIEDEILESVGCLRHFSMSEIGTLVSIELQGVTSTLKEKVASNLPKLWQTRGYLEWLQHCLPLVLMHLNTARGERACIKTPSLALSGWSVLWALPKVREFDPHVDTELVMYNEDMFGSPATFLISLERKKTFVYKRRVGTRMAMCIAADDVCRLLNNRAHATCIASERHTHHVSSQQEHN